MLEIDVFLGLDTVTPAIPGASPKIAQPDLAASHTGDDVIWHLHALDDNIEFVEVDFTGGDLFFDARGGGKTNKRHAKLDKQKGAGGKGGHGHILGTAPPIGSPGTKASKYTIKAYDGDPNTTGKVIVKYTLDPTVVTCDP